MPHLRARVRRWAAQGLAYGAVLATMVGLYLGLIRGLHREPLVFTAIVLLYPLGGLLGGAIVGAMLPLLGSTWGALLVGMAAATPIAVAAVSAIWLIAEIPSVWVLVGSGAFGVVCLGGGFAIFWRAYHALSGND